MTKKKTNPRRIPISKAESNKRVRGACERTCINTMALLMNVLRDKEGFEAEDLKRFCSECFELSNEIHDGRISMNDLHQVLKDEIGTYFVNVFNTRWL